jgi:hypothetical protein
MTVRPSPAHRLRRTKGHVQQIQHDRANHLLRIYIICQVSKSKIFRFTRILIYGINPAVPRPHEGRFAIVTMRWAQDAMDAAISGVTA